VSFINRGAYISVAEFGFIGFYCQMRQMVKVKLVIQIAIMIIKLKQHCGSARW